MTTRGPTDGCNTCYKSNERVFDRPDHTYVACTTGFCIGVHNMGVCCILLHAHRAAFGVAFGSRSTVELFLELALSCFLWPSNAVRISVMFVSKTIPAWTISSVIVCT